MKLTHLVLFVIAGAAVATAQTSAKPASKAATKAKPAVAAAGTHTASPVAAKHLAGPPAITGVKKVAFSLAYEDFKVGAGPVAEPNKMYTVNYTGWRAKDGVKFDSSFDHRMPVKDADGKPVLDADGKPKLGDPQPLSFPQGFGRLIPGFDQGVDGMKIGGKRRIFIPWQLAYGTRNIPDHDAEHPGIPAKSDLIFDVELVSVADLPEQNSAPGMPPHGASAPMHAPHPTASPNGTASAPGDPVHTPPPAEKDATQPKPNN
jgi:peptidylprolyl isomerase